MTTPEHERQAAAPASPADPTPPPAPSAVPHYQSTTPEQREIWEKKGQRGVGFGIAWLVGGLLLTLVTYSSSEGAAYIVAWGPMVYGIYRIVSGRRLLEKSKQH